MRNAPPDPVSATGPSAPATLNRFIAALARLHPDGRLGVAVSGGPDSLALLLLACAAREGEVEAATVDHGLRPDGAAEAALVAAACARLGIPHRILTADWRDDRGEGLQAAARRHRYRLLRAWAEERSLPVVATAHHIDDQAETVLMRLARGSGVSGMAAMRPVAHIAGLKIVRPLLGYGKGDLVAIAAEAGLSPVADPSNDDPRFDRTRARRLLAASPWLSPHRLAAVAANLSDADDALAWAADAEYGRRATESEGGVVIDPSALPPELLRRVVAHALDRLDPREARRGDELTRFVGRLSNGEAATLGAVMARPGDTWRLSLAPTRRA